MVVSDTDPSIINDTRGVSEVIGFILMFGIVILLITINQSQIVPQENKEIEFKHSQDVQDDLVEVQSSLSEAGQADVSQFSTVELGMYYPTRVLAINPPPAAGRLETRGPYNITITNNTASLDTGTTKNVSTRFLKYTPGYHEFDSPPTWYENSVLYKDAQDDGIAIIEDGYLGINDDDVALTALQNKFEESGTGRVTIEAHPVESSTTDIPTGNLTIRLPTRLTGEEYWHQYNSTSVYRGIDQDGGIYEEDGISEVELNIDTKNNEFKFNTVGLQSKPSEDGTSLRQNVGTGADDSESKKSRDSEIFNFLSITKSSGGEIVFNIKNNKNRKTTVTDFSVDFNYEGRYRGQNVDVFPDESQDGERNSKYNADGNLKSLNKQEAVVDAESDVTINLKDLEYKRDTGGWDTWDLGDRDLEQASGSEDADVIVTLYFESGGDQTFYFNESG